MDNELIATISTSLPTSKNNEEKKEK